MERKPLTPELRAEIVRLFLNGHSVNHIVFLLDYEWDGAHINLALRERLAVLERESARARLVPGQCPGQ